MVLYTKLSSPAALCSLLTLSNVICFASCLNVSDSHSPVINFKGSEYLDENQKYFLQWNISTAEKVIYFEVIAKTTGFVGFGISPKGDMTSADILISGVYTNGSIYSRDYHCAGNMLLEIDSHQDWIVTEAHEIANTTTIRFHRFLNTCNTDDLEIADGTMRVIWALGETDAVAFYNAKRGTKSVNLFSEDEHEFDPTQFQTLELVSNMTMTAHHTLYWCTFHKAPIFSRKQYIVAFDAILNNPAALKHVHHLSVNRCVVPPGEEPESIFGSWIASSGDHCYASTADKFPLGYCTPTPVYVWSKGGKRLIFPKNMGISMPDIILNRQEYFALEIHYDNPENIENLAFSTGVRIYYTDKKREFEVGLLSIDSVETSILIPPNANNFVVSGHCSSECTEKYFPGQGITIFNNLFHSHLTGRKMKLRHFRRNKELPWIDLEEYYDPNFQQNKMLLEHRKVLRGDQITVECMYDSTIAEDGKAVIGGFSTRDEMCKAIVYYYSRLPLIACGSGQDLKEHMSLFGITNYTLERGKHRFPADFVILEPISMVGDYRDAVSMHVNWSSKFLENYGGIKRYGEQVGRCVYDYEWHYGPVKYPDSLKEYVVRNNCTIDEL